MSELVLIERHEAAAVVVLNRPDKRNAISRAMLVELGQAVTEAARPADVRAVLIRANGPGFSAGIDLNAFSDLAQDYGPDWRSRMLEITESFQASLNAVAKCRVPTIALLHGFVLGLGMELTLACDLRIAAEGTQLALPEARLGLVPDVGGTTRLTRLVGPARAKQLIFTGRAVDAATAERWGLVNEVASAERLMEQGLALAAEIGRCAPLAVSAAKRVIDQLDDDTDGQRLEAWAQSAMVQSEDFRAGVQAAASKTAPQWQGR
jgi:enoyl-CoA hydratase/carnithine racemase